MVRLNVWHNGNTATGFAILAASDQSGKLLNLSNQPVRFILSVKKKKSEGISSIRVSG